MSLELTADVSCTQHGAMIDEILVAPCARPADILPALPDIQEGDEISLTHCKSAQENKGYAFQQSSQGTPEAAAEMQNPTQNALLLCALLRTVSIAPAAADCE